MRILNERRAAAEGSYVLMKKTNKCMKMRLLAAALLAGVMMGCSNVSNSGSGDSSGSGDGGQGGGDVQINDKYDTVWTLNADFLISGLGKYTFVNDGARKWEKSEGITEHTPAYPSSEPTVVDAKEEYKADGKGSSIATDSFEDKGFEIQNMKVYQYRGDNPLLTAEEEGKYYRSDIIKNFRFYRFTGTVDPGVGETFIQNLDNFIIAVDTATDFVYAYADITATDRVVITDVPTAFAAVEKNTEKNKDGTPFYRFDPIGYVNGDGTVILYEEYKTVIGKPAEEGGGTSYFPSVGEGDTVATKSENGFGRSPYYTK